MRVATTPYRTLMQGDRKNRDPHDFYRTPPSAVEMFVDHEAVAGPVWEPACGDGAISRVLAGRGLRVHSTDLYDHGFGRSGVDFTARPAVRFKFKTIMTNPPFKLGRQFAEAALTYRPQKLCLLMRLMWLETEDRARFFEATGLTRVWVHGYRIKVDRYGWKRKTRGGGMVPYAWFVWQRGHRGPAMIRWLVGADRNGAGR